MHKVTGGVCAGAVIAPRWVVTAAHCAKVNKYVLFGSANLLEAQRVEIKQAFRHPEFDADTLQNDVGLLLLEAPVPVGIAELASFTASRALLHEGAAAAIAGWGKTEKRSPSVERLVQSRTVINGLDIYGTRIRYADPATGPCGNDSGGPFVMRSKDGRNVLVGVISATDGNLCARGGGTAVITYLALAGGFIEHEILQRSGEGAIDAP